jgi:hypothetical protein
MRILHAVFSGNLQHLIRCIESWSNVDYGNNEVTRLLVVLDMENRNENIIEMLGKVHNCLLWRNPKEGEFESWVKTQNYDRILRQDDAILEKQVLQ